MGSVAARLVLPAHTHTHTHTHKSTKSVAKERKRVARFFFFVFGLCGSQNNIGQTSRAKTLCRLLAIQPQVLKSV